MTTIYVNEDQTLSIYTNNGKLIKDGFKNIGEVSDWINTKFEELECVFEENFDKNNYLNKEEVDDLI